MQHRARLFGIAYRILGSAAEAEDVVQEVWLRWQRTERSVVVSPAAFLSSTATRLAINVAQSARVRRETYIGPWLPEPIDTSSDPEVGAQRAEALELALLLVLEKLSPAERAAYVLREAFDYSYPEIAHMLRLSLVNARKIVSRARKHLSDEQRESVDTDEHRRLLNAFVSAARTGTWRHWKPCSPPMPSACRTATVSGAPLVFRCWAVPAWPIWRPRIRGSGERGRRVRRCQRPYGRDDPPRWRALHVHDDSGRE